MLLCDDVSALLSRLGVTLTKGPLPAHSPITGEVLVQIAEDSPAIAIARIDAAHRAFRDWRNVPAPKRGELVRLWAEELRAHKADLGRLVSIEVGKVLSEGLGEVQEMIDICDFALGLSRQLYGYTIASERPEHRMMETWHPLGVVGVISAFNFPVAVWSWNTALALVCGNAVVWKPSEKARFNAEGGAAPAGLTTVLIGGRTLGETLVDSPKVALVSATGSTRMGREVGPRVAARFGRSLLELGGNNAAIVAPTANLDLTLRGVAFAAMGTAGQRCTTLRRLFLHDSLYDDFLPRLKAAYASVKVGNPLEQGVLVGPLIDHAALEAMQIALVQARAAGGTVHGGHVVQTEGGAYVRPALVEMPDQIGPVLDETFAPILYVMKYNDFDNALEKHNEVSQGLSSSIFTNDMREAEMFLSARGSDCGIANVNIGPSGAEIGGAFGGEKETGGGRESGSDAWKAYMRRATNTLNYGRSLPLAQGVTFDIG